MTLGLGAALRSPAVWLGVLGSAAVAWGSSHPEFALTGTWGAGWVDRIGLSAPIPLDRVLLVGGALALIWSWWRLRPRPERPLAAGATLTVWSLPLLAAPPVLSPDAVLYADLGWTLGTGADPYLTGLAASGGPFAARVDPLWAGHGVAYPPLTLRLDQLLVWASGADPYWSVVAMRLPSILAVVAMLLLVPRLADLLGRPRQHAVWLAVLNPLLLLHFIGGAHNDAPMVAFSLAAVWLVARFPQRWAWLVAGPMVVGLAMAVKQQGGLTVVAVAGLPMAAALAALPTGRRLWLLGRRTAIAAAVAVATFVAISLASGLGFGWTRWLDLMGLADTPAPLALLSKGGAQLWSLGGGDPTEFLIHAGRVTTGILVIAVGWILIRFSDRPLVALAWSSAALAVFGQALHPWYLPWSVALLALCPLTDRQERWVISATAAFAGWNTLQTSILHGTV
jgi:hypothetical protein